MKHFLHKNFPKISQLLKDLRLVFFKSSYKEKVFCIGYLKTGTTSLGKSLQKLGYRNSTFNRKVWREYYAQGKMDMVLKYASKFDSMDDLPWLKEDMIPLLDKTFPNSKFVYLERDEDSWKKSMIKWTKKKTGTNVDLDKTFEEYKAHQNFVYEYFENRSGKDFITLKITDPQGFRKLAEFLGKKPIQDSFAHYNKT